MTGYEEQLLARAEMLEETGDLAQAVAEVLTGAQGAGVDPRAVTALVGTGVGRACLVVGLALEALAALWIRRILRSAG